MIDAAMIEAAAFRLARKARRTPFLSSPFLDEIAGRRVWVKTESLQHTGSFKFRGAWSAISALDDRIRTRGVIAYSSGNHAQAIAFAACDFGIPAVIVMPSDAPAVKIANTHAHGSEVVLYERDSQNRETIGAEIAAKRRMNLIKPYDEPQVIAGQGTVGLEIAEQAAKNDIDNADVLVCCGGGGLTSGIALALENRVPGLRVRPAEPEGFDDTARSLASGRIERNASETGGLCDAIMTPRPGEITFPILKRLCGPGIVVAEDDILRAMSLAFRNLKIVVEPGGAVGLAAALFCGNQIKGDAVIVVVTGGNVDPDIFAMALRRFPG